MVTILCPHCEEEIELEDDASGEFACPFCEGEFEWNMEPETVSARGASAGGGTARTGGGIPPIDPMAWVGHGLSIFMFIFVNFKSIDRMEDITQRGLAPNNIGCLSIARQ